MEKCELRPFEIDQMTVGQIALYFSDDDGKKTYEEVRRDTQKYWEKQAKDKAEGVEVLYGIGG